MTSSELNIKSGIKALSLGGASRFDVFFIVFGALPLFLPFIWYLGEQGLSSTTPFAWYFWMSSTVSAPHVYGSYIRVHRKIQEHKIHAFWGLPCYALVAGLLAFAAFKGKFVEAATAINVWQSYHYLRQVYGVSRFIVRADSEPDLVRKLSFNAYHLAMPLFILGRWDTLFTVWGGKASSTIIPVRMPDNVMFICWILAAAGIVCAIACELVRLYKSEKAFNVLPLLNVIVFYVLHWYGFLSVTYFQQGFFAVTCFHAVQYMSINWLMESKRTGDNTLTARIMRKFPVRFSFVLFWLSIFFLGFVWESWLSPITNQLWAKMSMILLMAVSAHHYTVDTRIWRKQAGP